MKETPQYIEQHLLDAIRFEKAGAAGFRQVIVRIPSFRLERYHVSLERALRVGIRHFGLNPNAGDDAVIIADCKNHIAHQKLRHRKRRSNRLSHIITWP